MNVKDLTEMTRRGVLGNRQSVELYIGTGRQFQILTGFSIEIREVVDGNQRSNFKGDVGSTARSRIVANHGN
jgi:hypothetical protein